MPKTWSGSHEYGDCSVNLQHNLFQVNIPKCASTWIKKYLALQGGWLGDNFVENRAVVEHMTALVILRDPMERWLSHRDMHDLIVNSDVNKIDCYDINNIVKLLASGHLDQHVTPQYDFISELDFTRTVFFRCDQFLFGNFRAFVQGRGMSVIDHSVYDNASEKNSAYLKYKENWLYVYNNIPEIKHAFDNCYQKDYELFNTVNFFEPILPKLP